ncbi:Swt1 family HEPN domain-containing protein [Pedobacter sp. KLB.chiD]|uniref:Swt1 family HEPN domain-containing protein n=1 Tax=Pedobacter sp. KLB.chiD TaxID=3387402 RepID=UPI00399AC43E
MTKLDIVSKIKLFALANSLTENQLDKVEKELQIELGRKAPEQAKKREYYLQFDSRFREEAKSMAEHYEVFYCLERSIRNLVVQLMFEKYGDNWWNEKVDEEIKKNVEKNIHREEDSGFTIRSEEKIDYTTFGELTQIVTKNWLAFENLFKRGQRAFQRITNNLNQLRGPIAHCCALADDEVVRLELTVKDWFRLME